VQEKLLQDSTNLAKKFIEAGEKNLLPRQYIKTRVKFECPAILTEE
jgi:hypothetical protein